VSLSEDVPSNGIRMRPILWRHFGDGDEVTRGTWLLDTDDGRRGLQPYGAGDAQVLEDAFLFLCWWNPRRAGRGCGGGAPWKDRRVGADTGESESGVVLLSIQVVGPNGKEQVVQFCGPDRILAVPRSFVGTLSPFKKRVYRLAVPADVAPCTPPADAEGRGGPDSKGDRSVGKRPVGDRELNDGPASDRMVGDGGFGDGAVDDGTLSDGVDNDREVGYIESGVEKISRCAACALAAPPLRPQPGGADLGTAAPPDNLLLVVHGVGEMLREQCLFGVAYISTFVKCVDQMRTNHAGLVAEVGGRAEYLPVEWHERFAELSRKPQEEDRTCLEDISLDTIPHLRAFANDTMLDVLYFMSPEYHRIIIDVVTSELNLVKSKFYQYNPEFKGKISIVAHSLGSIVMFDILGHQLDQQPKQRLSPDEPLMPFFNPKKDPRPNEANHHNDVPYPQLNFTVQHTFMIGSPIAVFLMIRNQSRLRKDYYLPGCARIYNIYHPYDPAAYRIEPLIDRRNAAREARILPKWDGGFRLQYRTKFFIRELVDLARQMHSGLVSHLEAKMSEMGIQDPEGRRDPGPGDVESEDTEDEEGVSRFGHLNGGRRIDYTLQEKEVENVNEYVFALSAHSVYWAEKDLTYFIAGQISGCDED